MILAAAQTKPNEDDINANLIDHYRLVVLAADEGVNLIVFPELSITGYQREKAKDAAFSVGDQRLESLKALAIEKKIIIVAGAPIQMGNQLFIGSFLLFPNGDTSIYTKQFLHPGEEVFYSSSFDYDPIIEIADERISLVICADIDHPEHIQKAKKKHDSIYIASLFFTPTGIPDAYNMLRNYAKKYSMNILIANYVERSWELEAGGQSAFWNRDGELVSAMQKNTAGLLIIKKEGLQWTGKLIVD